MKEQSATCGLVSASKPVSKLDQALDLAISLQKIQGQRDMLIEQDILECEVKRALGSITTNRASGGDRIPVEL